MEEEQQSIRWSAMRLRSRRLENSLSARFATISYLLPFIDDSVVTPRSLTRLTPSSRSYNEPSSVSGTLSYIHEHNGEQTTSAEAHPSSKLVLIAVTAILVSFSSAVGIVMTTSVTHHRSALIFVVGYLCVWLITWAISVILSTLLCKRTIRTSTYGHLLLACDALSVIAICGCFGWSLMAWQQEVDGLAAATGSVVLHPSVFLIWVVIMLDKLSKMRLLNSRASSERLASRYDSVRSLEEALADGDTLC